MDRGQTRKFFDEKLEKWFFQSLKTGSIHKINQLKSIFQHLDEIFLYTGWTEARIRTSLQRKTWKWFFQSLWMAQFAKLSSYNRFPSTFYNFCLLQSGQRLDLKIYSTKFFQKSSESINSQSYLVKIDHNIPWKPLLRFLNFWCESLVCQTDFILHLLNTKCS